MKILTYTKSPIYPDNSVIEWTPTAHHDGFVNRKLRFRVVFEYVGSKVQRTRLLERIDGIWKEQADFHEATLWCKAFDKDEAYAAKYDNNHGLHACHQLAEDIMGEQKKAA